MKKHSLRALLASFALLVATLAAAQDLPPDALVAHITQDVLDAIRADRELQAGDRAKALALAQEKILPHVDFGRMTRLAVGKAWRTATPEQQDALVREFRGMIVRTYSNALQAYRGQTMEVEPLAMAPDATDVTVRNRYLSPGRKPVTIDYAMWKTPEGWKVYDIVVAGISLVATYRSQFEEVIRQSGIDGLIAAMSRKSSPPDAAASR